MVFGGGLMFLIGTYILTNANLKNYFKKMNFKAEHEKLKKINALEIKRLEKQYGLTPTKTPNTLPSLETGGGLQALIPVFKNLSPELQEDLIERFLGGELIGGGGGGDAINQLLEIPAVQSFLEGFLANRGQNAEQEPQHPKQINV